jgi:hypothetical protein
MCAKVSVVVVVVNDFVIVVVIFIAVAVAVAVAIAELQHPWQTTCMLPNAKAEVGKVLPANVFRTPHSERYLRCI